jgi:hypothetical protein
LVRDVFTCVFTQLVELFVVGGGGKEDRFSIGLRVSLLIPDPTYEKSSVAAVVGLYYAQPKMHELGQPLRESLGSSC